MPDDLTHDESTHFAFGKNWAAYAATITADDIALSEADLKRLLGRDSLTGKRFLDIGCGSGVHALAALRMGADFVQGLDIDADSVETAQAVLAAHWPETNYKIGQANIFEIAPGDPKQGDLGRFDIVYSWGVLHHTGDMWKAIERAAAFVAPGGIFSIAIYRKTGFCRFWRWEKKVYTQRGALYRGLVIGLYMAVKLLRDVLRGRNPLKKIKGHNRKRGMKWHTDVIDWLGGYPYESAAPAEIQSFVEARGFRLIQSFRTRAKSGLLGSGNAEFLFERV